MIIVLIFIMGLLVFAIASTTSAIDLHAIRVANPPLVTEEGILFTYRPEKGMPKYAMVSGDFDNWRSAHMMIKNEYGIFAYLHAKTDERGIVLRKGIYRYRYLVDGIWMNDPLSDKLVYDSKGTALSAFEMKKPLIVALRNPLHLGGNDYLFYYRNERAKSVYIVGDFNNWNSYSHPMQKNLAGLWEVEIDIPPGRYAYRFIIDGNYKNDPLGRVAAYDRFNNEFTLLEVPLKEPPVPVPPRPLALRLQ